MSWSKEYIENEFIDRVTDRSFVSWMDLEEKFFYRFLLDQHEANEFVSKFIFRHSKMLDIKEVIRTWNSDEVLTSYGSPLEQEEFMMLMSLETQKEIVCNAYKQAGWEIYEGPLVVGSKVRFYFRDPDKIYSEMAKSTTKTLKYLSKLNQEERNFYVHLVEVFEDDRARAKEVFEDKETQSYGIETAFEIWSPKENEEEMKRFEEMDFSNKLAYISESLIDKEWNVFYEEDSKRLFLHKS